MIIELVYITVTYTCGCVKMRPVQPPRTCREIFSHQLCDFHREQALQEQVRRAALLKEKEGMGARYMVNGHPMTVYQSGLYWLGRRYEHSRAITKSFGKVDPRPLLEEAPVWTNTSR